MQGGGDVSYRGGSQKFVFVNSGMSFSKVMNKLYEVVGSDPRHAKLKVLMKYPMPGSYVAIPLDDDNALRAMWFAVTQISAIAMQLYIELLPKEPDAQNNICSFPEMDSRGCAEQQIPLMNQSVGMSSFTRTLINNKYINKHMSEFNTATPSLHIGTSRSTQARVIADSVDSNNINVIGCNEIDNDSDENEDEDVIEARDKVIRESAPTQYFNEVLEVNPNLLHSWMTWSKNNTFTSEGEFQIGQEFDSLQQLKDAIKSYSIARNQSIRVVEVEPEKYVVECKRKQQCNCLWRLRAVKNHTLLTFRIVRYNGPHASNCLGDIDSVDHELLTSEFVCNAILDLIRVNPSLKIKAIVQILKEKFHFTITCKRAWMAKQKAIKIINGD